MYKCKYCLESFDSGRALGGHTTKCQKEHSWDDVVRNVENGHTDFYERVLKKYLIHKFGERCMKCGWAERNQATNKVPIELNHKDGNSKNNDLPNLELICPNCHSLTPTFRGLNKGSGRKGRREIYRAGVAQLG